MSKNLKRAFAVVALTGLGISATGIGVAVGVPSWSSDKTGNGTGKAKKINFTVVGVTPDADLYPGAQDMAVQFTVANTSGFPIIVSDVAQTAAAVVTGCDTPATTVDAATAEASLLALYNTAARTIASGSEATFTVAGLDMGAASNNCQDATLTVPLTVTGTSVA